VDVFPCPDPGPLPTLFLFLIDPGAGERFPILIFRFPVEVLVKLHLFHFNQMLDLLNHPSDLGRVFVFHRLVQPGDSQCTYRSFLLLDAPHGTSDLLYPQFASHLENSPKVKF
jgi:hypothetical protein